MRSRLENRHKGRESPRRGADRTSLGGSAPKAAVAGMIGGAAMMLAMKIGQTALVPEEERMDPPPKRLVKSLAAKQGVEFDRQAMTAGMGVHMGYSALWGALYGVVQGRLQPPELLHGLLLGGLVYAANFPEWGLLPKVGALPSPADQDPEQAAVPVLAQVVYGVATSKAFEALH